MLNDSPLPGGDFYIISDFQWETRKSSFKTKTNLWPSVNMGTISVSVAGSAGITRTYSNIVFI